MIYAVAGVSGNTGKVVAESLLSSGASVRVIVRDPAKGEPWRARGAAVAVADLGDVSALTQALRSTAGAYLLVPPTFTAPDFRADQDRIIAGKGVRGPARGRSERRTSVSGRRTSRPRWSPAGRGGRAEAARRGQGLAGSWRTMAFEPLAPETARRKLEAMRHNFSRAARAARPSRAAEASP